MITRSKSQILNQNNPSISECIICFNDCLTRKNDITLLQCECKYYVHNTCFNQWIMQNEGQIRCIICRKNYPIVTVITSGIYYAHVDNFRNEMEQRMDNFNQRYVFDLFISYLIMCIVLFYLIIIIYNVLKSIKI